MIQCILNSRGFVASLLAGATGMALYFKVPFPAENVFLQLIALRTPVVYEGLFYSYSLFLFTTPYIGYSILLSALTREIRFLAKSGVKHEFDPSPAHRNRKQAGTTINAICF